MITQVRGQKTRKNIDFSESKSELLVIVANLRGALEAVKYDAISYIGFPLSR